MLSASVKEDGCDNHGGCGHEVHGAHSGFPDTIERVGGVGSGFDSGNENTEGEGRADAEHEHCAQNCLDNARRHEIIAL